jgi:hypothetical protein
VERRRGVLLREREREVAAVRRWRREEEVERGGSREHLEPEVEARRRAWGGEAGDDRREGGDAPTNLITFSASVLPSDVWVFKSRDFALGFWDFGKGFCRF